MIPTFSFDWVFTAVGWTLAAVGAAVLAWSLFWDRARGRRRCPKCWYDMAGVPGLTCPECGQAARDERALAGTRRRRRVAALAVATALGGYLTLNAPELRAHGPAGLVPSTVLLLWKGQLDRSSEGSRQLFHGLPTGRTALAEELYRRYRSGELSHWQQRIVSRALPIGRLAPDEFTVRDRWPQDVPLIMWGTPSHAEGCHPRQIVFTPLYAPGARIIETVHLADGSGPPWWGYYAHWREFPPPPPGRPPQVSIELRERGRGDDESTCSVQLWSTVRQLPVVVAGSPENALRPVESGDCALSFRLKLQHLSHGSGWATLSVVPQITVPTNVSVGLSVEFLEKGVPVAWATVCLSDGPTAAVDGDVNRLTGAQPDDLTIRVRGDPVVALRAHDAESYWKGEFTKRWSEIEVSQP